MAGTYAGGMKAKAANLANNPRYYEELGAKGGAASRVGGFNSSKVGKDGLTGPERASVAGQKGGKASRRLNGGWNEKAAREGD